MLYFILWETVTLFFKVVASFYILTSNVWGFQFFHILSNAPYRLSFLFQPSLWVWNDISLWFWFAFPWWLMMLSIFSCAYRPPVCHLWRNVYLNILPIFKSGCLSSYYWFVRVLYIFWVQVPIDHPFNTSACFLSRLYISVSSQEIHTSVFILPVLLLLFYNPSPSEKGFDVMHSLPQEGKTPDTTHLEQNQLSSKSDLPVFTFKRQISPPLLPILWNIFLVPSPPPRTL